jgi:hypothetical protein
MPTNRVLELRRRQQRSAAVRLGSVRLGEGAASARLQTTGETMIKPEEAKPQSQIVKNIDRKPCGCAITEYGDGRKLISPCVPCGLNASAQSMREAASALAQSADALSAVALTIRSAHQAADADAIQNAVKKAVMPLRSVP